MAESDNQSAGADTKRRIIESALELFGRFGFDGTSIRQIATAAGTNVASINYHFKNKDSLYWEIMMHTFKELDEHIASFSKESANMKELALKTYDHFCEERNALNNTMKMILTEGVNPSTDAAVIETLNNPLGPPGALHFAKKIQAEIPYKLSRAGLLWGVKSIFGSITHWAMICLSANFKVGDVKDPLMSEEQIREDVMHMVDASLDYLKKRRDLFEEKMS